MDNIEIYDKNNNKKQMELVTTIELKGHEYHYIIYKELDNSKMYLAKLKDNENTLNNDITNEELELCEKIISGVIE